MSFDFLAPHYRWMEWLLAGGKVQRCRTTFLSEVWHAQKVLLVGEGNGRFLNALLRVNRSAQVTVVDASAAMLRQAQRRAQTATAEATARTIEYVHADVLTWLPPAETYDLIVTHFFLDCFRPEQLERVIPGLASGAGPNAHWFVSDFHIPPGGLARWRARGILGLMYCFFRATTRIPARFLAPIAPLLERSGFQLQKCCSSEWGLLHAGWWRRHQGG